MKQRNNELLIGELSNTNKQTNCYLDLSIHNNWESEENVRNGIKANGLEWGKALEILCDKRIPTKLKEKFSRMVITSVMLYKNECCIVEKHHI